MKNQDTSDNPDMNQTPPENIYTIEYLQSLNHNIDSYTIGELLDTLNIDTPTDAAITNSIQTFQTVVDKSKKTIGTKQKLTTFLKESKQALEENLKDEDDETGDTKKDTKSTFTVPVATDDLNPLLQNIIERTICVDSQYRNREAIFETTTDYSFQLSEPLQHVLSIRLYHYGIPITSYNVDSNNYNNFFWVQLNNLPQPFNILITIPSGNYNDATIISQIISELELAGFDFQNSSEHQPITQNSTNGKIQIDFVNSGAYYKPLSYTITDNDGLLFYAPDLITTTGQCTGNYKKMEKNNTLGWNLGFRDASVKFQSTMIMEQPPQIPTTSAAGNDASGNDGSGTTGTYPGTTGPTGTYPGTTGTYPGTTGTYPGTTGTYPGTTGTYPGTTGTYPGTTGPTDTYPGTTGPTDTYPGSSSGQTGTTGTYPTTTSTSNLGNDVSGNDVSGNDVSGNDVAAGTDVSGNYYNPNTVIQATSLPDFYGPKYYVITLDDMNQHHVNGTLISIGHSDSSYVKLPKFLTQGLPMIRTESQQYPNGAGINNDMEDNFRVPVCQVLPTIPRTLTQAQMYYVNAITQSNNKTKETRTFKPSLTNTFAILPNKVSTSSKFGDMNIEFGGSMQNHKRVYFGPVNITRMRVKLMDDKGCLVNLNNMDWSFTLIAETLYKF